MNMKLVLYLSIALAATSAQGQDTFQNLDFQAAQLTFESSNSIEIATSNALPGWSAFSGTSQLSAVPYFNGSAFAYAVALVGTNAFNVDGNFATFLSQGGSVGSDIYGPGSISQTGTVPVGSKTLLFYAFSAPSSSLLVALNGQNLSYEAVSSVANSSYFSPVTLYGADISGYAGQTETLQFSVTSRYSVLDDIQFSSQPVPEPSVLALLLVASGILALLRVSPGWRLR
jgi:hypothetical protein